MVQEVGLKEAFLEFAADSAVLYRNGKIIKGKQQLATYFDSRMLQNVSLEWESEFVNVAKAGDMAYAYGPFTFSAISEEGEPKQLWDISIQYGKSKRMAAGSLYKIKLLL